MERRKLLATVGSTVAAASLAGCTGFGGDDGSGNETPEKAGTSAGKQVSVEEDVAFDAEADEVVDPTTNATLKLLNSRLVETVDSTGVLGSVRNTGNETYTFVKVTATLYDQSDDVLGKFFDDTEGSAVDELAPGEVWDFEIFFEDADLGAVASYSLAATAEVAGDEGEYGADGNESAGDS